MTNKQNQRVGDDSTAIQVNGDVSIVTPYTELRAIIMDLFELNFPKVQAIARSTANQRIDAFLGSLKNTLALHKDKIDNSKFADPGIQFEINGMIVDAAKRGEKSNFDLLSELLCTVLEKDCPELVELIAVEARKAIPMLAKKHLSCLSILVLAKEAQIGDNISSINEYLEAPLRYLQEASSITLNDLRYIECTGSIIRRPVILKGIIPEMISKLPDFNGKSDEQSLEICEGKGLGAIQTLIEMTKKCMVGYFQLSAIGSLIGWLNISDFTGSDIKAMFQ